MVENTISSSDIKRRLSQIRVGLSHSENPEKQKKTWEILYNLANSEIAEAQALLASYYEEESLKISPIHPDKEKQIFWLQKATNSFNREVNEGNIEGIRGLLEIYGRRKSPLYSPKKRDELQHRKLEFALKEAEAGNLSKQEYVIHAFIDGYGCEENFDEARKWLEILEKEVMESSHGKSLINYLVFLARMYLKIGDKEQAHRIYDEVVANIHTGEIPFIAWQIYDTMPTNTCDILKKAVDEGDFHCLAPLGEICLEESYGMPHLPMIRNCLNRISEEDESSRTSVKEMYRNATKITGLWSSYFEALGKGVYDADAAFELTNILSYVTSPFSYHDPVVTHLLHELSEIKNPHQISAELRLGVDAYQNDDRKSALHWFERAAQHGLEYANLLAGSLCLVPESPAFNAEKAAEHLNAAKEYNTQFFFSVVENGLNFDTPFKIELINRILQTFVEVIYTVEDWFLADANAGDAVSQFWIAVRYLGKTLPREPGIDYPLYGRLSLDKKRGLKYLRLSAAQGYASAEYLLGRLMLQGTIIEDMETSAETWLKKAAEDGFEKIGRIDTEPLFLNE